MSSRGHKGVVPGPVEDLRVVNGICPLPLPSATAEWGTNRAVTARRNEGSCHMADSKKAAATVRVEKTRSGFRGLVAGNPNYFGNLPASGFKPVKKLATNTNYEELTSVGYNPLQRRLYATFDIKKSGGYSGDLCDDGSTEYVRFFVDFGSGWLDAGLAATDVHDIPAEHGLRQQGHPSARLLA